jgi:hypothetical protein
MRDKPGAARVRDNGGQRSEIRDQRSEIRGLWAVGCGLWVIFGYAIVGSGN